MDGLWPESLYVLLPALCGGLIQTTTGFGFGLFVMMFYPVFLPVTEASALSTAVGLLLSGTLVWRLRAHLKIRELLFPLGVDLVFGFASVLAARLVDVSMLKAFLGLFLVAMALYLLFLSGRFAVRANRKTAFVSCALGGISSGFFGIGGPPVLPYFLAAYGDDKLAYIASLQFLFSVTSISNTAVRAASGIFTWRLLLLAVPGAAGMFIGRAVGLKIVDRIRADQLKRIVYLFLGLAGVLTFAANI